MAAKKSVSRKSARKATRKAVKKVAKKAAKKAVRKVAKAPKRRVATRKAAPASRPKAASAPKPAAAVSPAVMEIDRRIAILRANLRDLVEQAASYSGASDDERMSQRIAEQEAKLASLIKQREDFAKSGL